MLEQSYDHTVTDGDDRSLLVPEFVRETALKIPGSYSGTPWKQDDGLGTTIRWSESVPLAAAVAG